MGKGYLELEVKFTKIGNRIKYTLPVNMVCEHGNELQNSMTLDKTDMLIVSWLGNDVDKCFKKGRVIFKKVNLNQAYDICDKTKSKKH